MLQAGGKEERSKYFSLKKYLIISRSHYNYSKHIYNTYCVTSPVLSLQDALAHLLLLTFWFLIFIYLAASGLSFGTQDLCCVIRDLSLQRTESLV